MLDDSIDPLSIGARTEKANKLRDQLSHAAAPPAEDKQPAARAVAPTTATAQTAPESKVPDDVAALLAREKAYSDSFKDEVERMVRESIAAERRQELDRELDARLPPGPGVASKPAGERDHYGNIKELLEAAGLPQYVEQFEQEAMDSETLYGVMESQGCVPARCSGMCTIGYRSVAAFMRASLARRIESSNLECTFVHLHLSHSSSPQDPQSHTSGSWDSTLHPLVPQSLCSRRGPQGARRQLQGPSDEDC
eukprot:scaffold180060_cov31-Tisochrysis_lutea.AAC.2